MEWKGQGRGLGLEKSIFTEDHVLFGLPTTPCVLEKNRWLITPAIRNGVPWKVLGEQHPKIQCFSQSPHSVLCVSFLVLGSAFVSFLSSRGTWVGGFCSSGSSGRFCSCKLWMDFSPRLFRNSERLGDKSPLFSLKQHKVPQTSPSRRWWCSTQSPRKTG